jgi:hypothetical protein
MMAKKTFILDESTAEPGSDSWHPTMLKTVEECDETRIKLTGQIADIEAQVDAADREAKSSGQLEDPHWFRTATRALKFKRLALQMTLDRRGQLAKQERMNRSESSNNKLLKLLIETDRPAWDRLIAEARRRWPDEFKSQKEGDT